MLVCSTKAKSNSLETLEVNEEGAVPPDLTSSGWNTPYGYELVNMDS